MPASVSVEVGGLLKGNHTGNVFEVRGIFPAGVSGVVFRAVRRKDRRSYVIKTLKTLENGYGIDPFGLRGQFERVKSIREQVLRFHREASLWIALARHPHVVQALWYDQDEQARPFLVMELVRGQAAVGTSLREHIVHRCGRPFEAPEALKYVLQAISGLKHAGNMAKQELGRKFVHGDIKPENLLIDGSGDLKVTDFGIGYATCGYMSPEQVRRVAVSEKTDVYALGCVLCELLTGHLPSRGRIDGGASMPGGLLRAIRRCLRTDPARRPSFDELTKSLQACFKKLVGRKFPLKTDPIPMSAEDWNARGSGYNALRQYEKATDCFDRAVALQPEDYRFYVNRANAFIAGERYEDALKDLESAEKLAPGTVEIKIAQGRAHFLMNNIEKSLKELSWGRSLYAADPLVCIVLGRVLAGAAMSSEVANQKRLEQLEQAEDNYWHALWLNPASSEAMVGIGNICRLRNRQEDAEDLYLQAVSANPLNENAWSSLVAIGKLAQSEFDDIFS